MKCRACQERVIGGAGRVRLIGQSNVLARPSALRALTCAECGAVLPEADEGEAWLRKLLQLSRFGLCAGARPLLEPRRVGR